MSEEPAGHKHTRRDAEILQALGAFLVVLALPVLAGTFFADSGIARLVNASAGAVVALIGVAMFVRGRRMSQLLR